MIISASRRTDIPAFYTPWLLNRLAEGFALVRQPYNPRRVTRVPLTPGAVDGFVFWTKNAAPLTPHLDAVDALGAPYYFQYTITPYGREIEAGIPEPHAAAEQLRELSRRLGPGRVVWRYDPIILTPQWTPAAHGEAFRRLCAALAGYTDTCVISFADRYQKTDRNAADLPLGDAPAEIMTGLAAALAETAKREGAIAVQACCEPGIMGAAGVGPSACVDGARLERIAGRPVEFKKDRNQRSGCGCAASVDLGQYDTCPGGCRYCYAVRSPERARAAFREHDERSPLLMGRLTEQDTVVERR